MGLWYTWCVHCAACIVHSMQTFVYISDEERNIGMLHVCGWMLCLHYALGCAALWAQAQQKDKMKTSCETVSLSLHSVCAMCMGPVGSSSSTWPSASASCNDESTPRSLCFFLSSSSIRSLFAFSLFCLCSGTFMLELNTIFCICARIQFQVEDGIGKRNSR